PTGYRRRIWSRVWAGCKALLPLPDDARGLEDLVRKVDVPLGVGGRQTGDGRAVLLEVVHDTRAADLSHPHVLDRPALDLLEHRLGELPVREHRAFPVELALP